MITVVTAPTVEPIPLAEANFHLRLVTTPADVTALPTDAEVSRLISTAREYAEQFCSRAFAAATYQATGPDWCVPLLSPVTAITSVQYLDSDGAEQTLVNTVYELGSNPGAPVLRLKVGQTWPALYARDDAVRVVFAAGPAPAAVPFMVKAAMLLLMGTLFNVRQSDSDRQTFALPLRVQDLLWPFRLSLGV